MRPFNIDLYDKNIHCIYHTEVPPFKIDMDYLSPNENEFEIVHIKNDEILENALFVSISNAVPGNIFSPISRTESGNIYDKITFKTAESIFDRTILLDLSNEGSGISAEEAIATIIRKEWVNTSDEYEKYAMTITTSTETMEWTYALQSDYGSKIVVNFYTEILAYFLEKYHISVSVTCNYETKRIYVDIRNSSNPFNIEADLQSVEVLNFTIKDQSESVNKLTVWNGNNFQDSVIYYMHNNGKWDIIDEDRVLPVKSTVSIVQPTEDETFESLAYKEAYDTFTSMAWNNLIELNFIAADKLVNPMKMAIGQNVKIIYHGKSYDSVLTAKLIESDSTVTLTFGAIRHDLTKIISKQKGV